MISLETTDLFRGAFFLCKGGQLTDIRLRKNGKCTASFLIEGDGLDRHESDYINGKAQVNPLQFRESLNRLRDIMFEKLHQTRGKMRYEKRNRGDQKRHRSKNLHRIQGHPI